MVSKGRRFEVSLIPGKGAATLEAVPFKQASGGDASCTAQHNALARRPREPDTHLVDDQANSIVWLRSFYQPDARQSAGPRPCGAHSTNILSCADISRYGRFGGAEHRRPFVASTIRPFLVGCASAMAGLADRRVVREQRPCRTSTTEAWRAGGCPHHTAEVRTFGGRVSRGASRRRSLQALLAKRADSSARTEDVRADRVAACSSFAVAALSSRCPDSWVWHSLRRAATSGRGDLRRCSNVACRS